jgi:tRNA threonylcarbamoyladenosine modification (KEOPS) complex  Pcc1 subunit
MRLNAQIKAFGSPEEIYGCFQPEQKEQDRSRFRIKKEKDGVLFLIESNDSIALRATLNSITKLLTVYEKLENGKRN